MRKAMSFLFFSFLLMVAWPLVAEAQAVPSVDLKVSINNGPQTDGPVTVGLADSIVAFWTSSKTAGTLTASGDWSGEKPLSGSEILPVLGSGVRTFVLTGHNKSGRKTATDSVTVTVIPPPSIDLRANGLTGQVEVQAGSTVTLSWTVSGATSVTASGDWPFNGPKAAIGVEEVSSLNAVNNFTLTAVGAGGIAAGSVTVNATGIPEPGRVKMYLPDLRVGWEGTPGQPGSRQWLTELVLTSRVDRFLVFEEFFLNSLGQPTEILFKLSNSLEVDGVASTTGGLNAKESLTRTISMCQSCPPDFRIGVVEFDLPTSFSAEEGKMTPEIEVTVEFRTVDSNGNVLFSFVSRPVEPKTGFTLPAISTSQKETSLVVFNSNDQSTAVLVKCFSLFGPPNQSVAETFFVVPARTQIIKSVAELFPDLVSNPFGNSERLTDGNLEILSDLPVAVSGFKKLFQTTGLPNIVSVPALKGR